MDKIDDYKYTLRSWCTKNITEPDKQWYIFKYFKKGSKFKPFSFEKQGEILEKKKQYIWKFIPETELIKNDDGSYCIRQKFIEWRLLKFIDINQLDERVLSDLLELLKWYIAYCKDTWTTMDVLGYQEDIHNLENIRKRRFLSYARILNSSLSSTNIMISNDNKVYMIDVCDTVSENKHRKLQKIKDTVRQAIIEIWIKKAFFKIQFLIKRKRNELFNILSI